MPNLWLLARPLVLASKSRARRSLLAAAGIPFEAIDADVDERALEAPTLAAGGDGATIAALLARKKAMAVSASLPDRFVLGADQTLSIGDAILSKPADRASARAQLAAMAGRTHRLHAALCLTRDGTVVATACAEARLTCRPFTDAFLDDYLELAGDGVLGSVGGYALEGLGIHLFETIVGEHSTILGLPMLELLALLRDHGALKA